MEKRTLLAFALSFMILILWSVLYAPQAPRTPAPEGPAREAEDRGPRVEPASPESAPGARTEASDARPPAGEAVPVPVSPELMEQEISVETPLYSAVWSNLGGAIRSFKLKEYRETPGEGSPPVELAALGSGENGLLGFHFALDEADGARPLLYDFSDSSIVVTPESGTQTLVMTGRTPEGVVVEETYLFHPDRYLIDVTARVVNRGEAPVRGSVSARLKNHPPSGSQSYYGFVGLALLLNGELNEIKPKKMKDEDMRLAGRIGWMAYEDDYFMVSVLPDTPNEGSFRGRQLPSGALEALYKAPEVRLGLGEQVSAAFSLYLGPRDLTVLSSVGRDLERAISFGWTDIIAKPLLHALRFFNKFLHNYGFSIIILTILIKILFWPLTHKSYKSMKEMQKIQPIMAKIRTKYKDNKEQMNREMMQLYKTYKVNPLGGCLPMLIQIPVFFALFRILSSSIELRHTPFILWINDLSAPDRLFNFPFQIPFMAPPSGIPVLTLLMGASMFLQQKMSPAPGDPTQAKIMMFLPVVFTFVFINFPSGLVLYWLTNNILSIGQQYRILKKPG
jgi:YidC/Oxa1 family membrane protein insertase